MDAATFVVNMVDKVSGPAHRAAKQIEDLEKQIKKTGRAGIEYTGTGAVPDVIKRINRKNLGTLVKSRIVNPLGEKAKDQADDVLSSLTHMAKYGAIAVGAAGVAAGTYAVKATVEMGMFAEKTRLAFGLLTGDKALGEATFTRTIELSKQLGMDVEDTAHTMQKLLAMQMSPAAAENWIKLGSDLRSVGVTDSALQRVMLDVAHVKATGKLNQRNVNMFANAGVSAQLLMEEVGAAMGTDEKGAMEAMHKGQITSDIALPALQRAIMRKTHEHSAGEAGSKFANETLSGLTGQLKNAPHLFFLRMADAASGSIGNLKKLVDQIKSSIEGISGEQFVRFINTALDIATKMVPLALEFAKGFGDGFSEMNDAFAQLDPSQASLATARDMGHAMANAFKLALEAIKKVLEAVEWLDKHREVAAGLGIGLGVDRVFGAGSTIGAGKALYKGGKWALGKTLLKTAAPAAEVAGTVAEGAAGATGLTALLGGLGGAGLAAGGAALAGVGAAGLSYAYREEIANWMLGIVGNKDQAEQRGLGAPSPTGALAALTTPRQQTNNVNFQSTIAIDGAQNDPNQIARTVSDSQRGMMEQFFQSQALESGATG